MPEAMPEAMPEDVEAGMEITRRLTLSDKQQLRLLVDKGYDIPGIIPTVYYENRINKAERLGREAEYIRGIIQGNPNEYMYTEFEEPVRIIEIDRLERESKLLEEPQPGLFTPRRRVDILSQGGPSEEDSLGRAPTVDASAGSYRYGSNGEGEGDAARPAGERLNFEGNGSGGPIGPYFGNGARAANGTGAVRESPAGDQGGQSPTNRRKQRRNTYKKRRKNRNSTFKK
jgi:hypothetical protein